MATPASNATNTTSPAGAAPLVPSPSPGAAVPVAPVAPSPAASSPVVPSPSAAGAVAPVAPAPAATPDPASYAAEVKKIKALVKKYAPGGTVTLEGVLARMQYSDQDKSNPLVTLEMDVNKKLLGGSSSKLDVDDFCKDQLRSFLKEFQKEYAKGKGVDLNSSEWQSKIAALQAAAQASNLQLPADFIEDHVVNPLQDQGKTRKEFDVWAKQWAVRQKSFLASSLHHDATCRKFGPMSGWEVVGPVGPGTNPIQKDPEGNGIGFTPGFRYRYKGRDELINYDHNGNVTVEAKSEGEKDRAKLHFHTAGGIEYKLYDRSTLSKEKITAADDVTPELEAAVKAKAVMQAALDMQYDIYTVALPDATLTKENAEKFKNSYVIATDQDKDGKDIARLYYVTKEGDLKKHRLNNAGKPSDLHDLYQILDNQGLITKDSKDKVSGMELDDGTPVTRLNEMTLGRKKAFDALIINSGGIPLNNNGRPFAQGMVEFDPEEIRRDIDEISARFGGTNGILDRFFEREGNIINNLGMLGGGSIAGSAFAIVGLVFGLIYAGIKARQDCKADPKGLKEALDALETEREQLANSARDLGVKIQPGDQPAQGNTVNIQPGVAPSAPGLTISPSPVAGPLPNPGATNTASASASQKPEQSAGGIGSSSSSQTGGSSRLTGNSGSTASPNPVVVATMAASPTSPTASLQQPKVEQQQPQSGARSIVDTTATRKNDVATSSAAVAVSNSSSSSSTTVASVDAAISQLPVANAAESVEKFMSRCSDFDQKPNSEKIKMLTNISCYMCLEGIGKNDKKKLLGHAADIALDIMSNKQNIIADNKDGKSDQEKADFSSFYQAISRLLLFSVVQVDSNDGTSSDQDNLKNLEKIWHAVESKERWDDIEWSAEEAPSPSR